MRALLRARAPFLPAALATTARGLRLMSPLGPTYFLKTLGRPQWLFEKSVDIPFRPVTLTEPPPPSSDALELSARIIDAYRLAREGYGELSSIWTEKVARYCSALEEALKSGDPAAVNEQLRWMFRRPFLAGISMAIDFDDPAATRFWPLVTSDSLVSLAEAVGALHTENPEQGPAGRAFIEGIDSVPERVEQRLGISLDYPRVGAPFGIMIGGRLISRETGLDLHAAVRLHEVVRNDLQRATPQGARILEIGAGFGGVAMWYLRLLQSHPGSYTIIDLPLMNAFQAYFLGTVYGGDDVSLYGEPSNGARIKIGPPSILTETDVTADVVFNQDSMPEMTETAAHEYLAWMHDNLSGLFVSCNQEVGTHGAVEQLVVGELTMVYDSLTRISRQPSWMRRGYIEEVYRCRGAKS